MIFLFITYQILQLCVPLPIFACYLVWRKLKGKPAFGSLKERCGFVPKSDKTKEVVWIHAVSVGEIFSIQHFVKQLKNQNPNVFCFVTTGTITGKQIAQKHLNADCVSFLPYDFLPSILLGYHRINPSRVFVVESELWPNLLMLAKYKKIPLYSINARVSARSFARLKTFSFIFKELLNLFQNIFTQTQEDKKRFEVLGVKENKLKVFGNIKTFNVLQKQQEQKNWVLESKIILNKKDSVLLVGSLHPGELDIYLRLFKELRVTNKNIKLILAPRHFNWKKELIEKVKATGFTYNVWDETLQEDFDKQDILLVCMLGKLFDLYKISDIFFLGGTFVPVGGHNLLEPAVWKKVSIVGPHIQNCKTIADDLEKNNALIKVADEIELQKIVKDLLQDSERRIQMGENAFEWLTREANIVGKNLRELGKLFN